MDIMWIRAGQVDVEGYGGRGGGLISVEVIGGLGWGWMMGRE